MLHYTFASSSSSFSFFYLFFLLLTSSFPPTSPIPFSLFICFLSPMFHQYISFLCFSSSISHVFLYGQVFHSKYYSRYISPNTNITASQVSSHWIFKNIFLVLYLSFIQKSNDLTLSDLVNYNNGFSFKSSTMALVL